MDRFHQVAERVNSQWLQMNDLMLVFQSFKGCGSGKEFPHLQFTHLQFAWHSLGRRRRQAYTMNSVHSATTRSTIVRAVHAVDRRRVLQTTPINRRLAVSCHGKPVSVFFGSQDWVSVRRVTTRNASLALNAGEPIRGRQPGGLISSFALRLGYYYVTVLFRILVLSLLYMQKYSYSHLDYICISRIGSYYQKTMHKLTSRQAKVFAYSQQWLGGTSTTKPTFSVHWAAYITLTLFIVA